MKKLIVWLLLVCLLPFNVFASDSVVPNAKNALLIEVSTGTIIYEKNKDERVSIASLTKMMGLILIFERIESGSLKYTDKVTASSNASGMGGSQIWLETGEVMSVEDLLKGIIMASANDGIVAMAEKISGTEDAFVELMNQKAKELGLVNTNFVNCTGLDEEGHYSSAYDVSVIARELMKHEDVFKFTTNYEDYLRVNTNNKFWLVNTNKLIKTYSGADGLKTGMTDNAGYCMAVTAKRNNMRLLAVVLGEKEGKVRNKETSDLLDYGFNNYEVITIKKK
ncbi:MAG: D-alanyl-D-alanine carboxypeptidase, partial [Bacilli bacterium]|nr:D-alanyl-D-alanine carboxypeptidase [Bacilli bacterium]